jgi:hypothetical protein
LAGASISDQLLSLFHQVAASTVQYLAMLQTAGAARVDYLDQEIELLWEAMSSQHGQVEREHQRLLRVADKWKAGSVRKQFELATRIIAAHTKPLIDRTHEAPIDKVALLSELKGQTPEVFTGDCESSPNARRFQLEVHL